MVNIERYIPFLSSQNLSENQFLFLACIYHNKRELLAKYAKFFSDGDKINKTIISQESLQDLINKDFLVLTGDFDSSGTPMYKISNKFTKIYVDKLVAYREVSNQYPRTVPSRDGKFNIPLKGGDVDELSKRYWAAINGSVEEHLDVIKDIIYARDNNIIEHKIENFIKSEMWLDYRKEREKDELNVNNEISPVKRSPLMGSDF